MYNYQNDKVPVLTRQTHSRKIQLELFLLFQTYLNKCFFNYAICLFVLFLWACYTRAWIQSKTIWCVIRLPTTYRESRIVFLYLMAGLKVCFCPFVCLSDWLFCLWFLHRPIALSWLHWGAWGGGGVRWVGAAHWHLKVCMF